MKKVLILLLFSVQAFCYAQAPKGAKTIVVLTDSLSEDAIAMALIEQGYEIASTNKYSIKSEPKNIKSWGFQVVVSKVSDGYRVATYASSSISVYVGSGVSTGPSTVQCKNRGTKNSAWMIGWKQAESVANALGNNFRYEM